MIISLQKGKYLISVAVFFLKKKERHDVVIVKGYVQSECSKCTRMKHHGTKARIHGGMPANEFDRKNVIRSLREDAQILHMEAYTCKWLHVHEDKKKYKRKDDSERKTAWSKTRFTWEPQSVMVQSESFAGLTIHVSTRPDKRGSGKDSCEFRWLLRQRNFSGTILPRKGSVKRRL